MSLIYLETSYSSSRSSSSDQQYDSIPFEMVDRHQLLRSGNFYSSVRSQGIPFYGCQSLWKGSSSQADETILSRSRVGRPIAATYQYAGNNGHSFGTEECHETHAPLLCHDFYRQYNSRLLYQQTRRNTFPQPMHGGIGDPPLVPGTRYHYQNLSYSRQIQYIGRPSFETGLTSQNRMGFGSVGGELHFPNAQFSQCGFVCDTIQSQTPTVCISSSGQSSLSDRCIINELEFSSYICISTNNSDTLYSSQDTSILVQNSSYCSSLASTSLVFRGVTTIVSTPICLLLFPKLLTQAKGKFQHLDLPVLALHTWELSSNQLEIKTFHKTLQILSQNQDEHLLRKSVMQNGSYTPVGVIERR